MYMNQKEKKKAKEGCGKVFKKINILVSGGSISLIVSYTTC